jgi:hypothetical protein
MTAVTVSGNSGICLNSSVTRTGRKDRSVNRPVSRQSSSTVDSAGVLKVRFEIEYVLSAHRQRVHHTKELRRDPAGTRSLRETSERDTECQAWQSQGGAHWRWTDLSPHLARF